MTLADLRKELKDLRKKAMPTPVSRMKKGDVAAELEKLKGLHGKEVEAVKEVLTEAKAPKAAVKKTEAVQKKAHVKEELVVKKTAGLKRSASPPPAKKAKAEPKSKDDKPSKGSEEMKARMAKLREMRMKKKEEA